jgi:hypothetical protein
MATPINEMTVKALNKELNDLMKAFATKHGLQVGRQGIKYARDGSTMNLTVVFGAMEKTSGVNPVWYRNGTRHGFIYGLDSKDIGTFEFKYGAKGMVKYVGMSSPKFAIYQTADGKYWKADPEVLSNVIKAAKALAKA